MMAAVRSACLAVSSISDGPDLPGVRAGGDGGPVDLGVGAVGAGGGSGAADAPFGLPPRPGAGPMPGWRLEPQPGGEHRAQVIQPGQPGRPGRVAQARARSSRPGSASTRPGRGRAGRFRRTRPARHRATIARSRACSTPGPGRRRAAHYQHRGRRLAPRPRPSRTAAPSAGDGLIVGIAAAASYLGYDKPDSFRRARTRNPVPGEGKTPDGRPCWTPQALRSWQSRRKIAGSRPLAGNRG